MSKQVLIETFERQTEFVAASLSGRYQYLLYGGAIRGGKTVVLLAIIFILCRVFPGSRWALVRKDLPTIRRNLLPTFNKFKPDFVGPVNKSEWISTCSNGSQIIFFPESIKDDPDGDRFRGLEVNGFGNEEANELQQQTFTREMERVGLWTVPGLAVQPPKLILNTCNPAQGWVKDMFYNKWRTGTLEAPYFYLPARADDNPHISEEIKAGWKNLPEKEYKRFVLGDWDVADDPDQLIKFEWVHGAYDVEAVGGRTKLGVDVARFGDDDTTLARIVGNELVEIVDYHGLSIDRTANIVAGYMTEHRIGADLVGVDTVGLGAGVADNLRAMGYPVKEVISGASSIDVPALDGMDSSYLFRNLRSQMWWYARERLRLGEVRIGIRDQKLVDDLLAPRYKISSDRMIQVESKDDIKKRLGRSTDRGDAFVYSLFLEHIPELDFTRI